MQYLKRGEDFITPEGEIVANELLTVAPPPARSFAYMTCLLYTSFVYSMAGRPERTDLSGRDEPDG